MHHTTLTVSATPSSGNMSSLTSYSDWYSPSRSQYDLRRRETFAFGLRCFWGFLRADMRIAFLSKSCG